MFDARSILDALVTGSSEQTRGAREGGGLNDIMSDILKDLQPDTQQQQQAPRRYNEQAGDRGAGGQARNPLEDLFGGLGEALGGGHRQEQTQRDRYEPSRQAQPDTYGSNDRGSDMPSGVPGEYGEVFNRVKDLVANNKTAAGVIVGGLGGLLLGTRTGRSLAGRAARLGGVALIGTLAYKAFKNYQAGSSPSLERDGGFDLPESLPPGGSGYEAETIGNDQAILFIRTMVAAAAADGHVDHEEQQKILGNMEQAGLDAEAMEFLANEFNNPANIDEIISMVGNREQAAQVYTAARIAIEPDTREEQQFLSYLAERLDLDSALAAHIDAAAMGVKVR